MSSPGQYDLVVTSERSFHRHIVLINGQAARLTHGAFQLLLELAIAHAHHRYVSDPTTAYGSAIFRLRKSIDEALRERGAGKLLIETGEGAEYRLRPGLTMAIDNRCGKLSDTVCQKLVLELSMHFPIVDCVGSKIL